MSESKPIRRVGADSIYETVASRAANELLRYSDPMRRMKQTSAHLKNPNTHTNMNRIQFALDVMSTAGTQVQDLNITLKPSDIEDHIKQYNELPYSARALMRRYFSLYEQHMTDPQNPDSLEHIQNLIRWGDGTNDYINQIASESIIDSYFSFAFDPGLRRNVVFQPEAHGEVVDKEKAQYVFRRSAFVHVMKENELFFRPQATSYSFIDIHGVRNADYEVPNPKSHKSADVIINRTVKSIDRAISRFCKEFSIPTSERPLIGRYGGDEIVIGWITEMDEAKKTRFGQILQGILDSPSRPQQGYFRSTDSVELEGKQVRRTISLKDDKIEWIEKPMSQDDKAIFDRYFNRGLILKAQEIKHIKEKNIPYVEPHYYPPSAKTVEDKINYLCEQHPEIAQALLIARYWDVKTSQMLKIPITFRQESLLRFAENVIFDRLLGSVVFSKFDFQEHMKRKEIENIIAIDLKFVKEMNDMVGYVEADEAIGKLWERINHAISEPDKNKIIIARGGGTFMLGIRTGEQLSSETLEALKHITSLELDLELSPVHKEVTVPIGNSMLIESGEPQKSLQDALALSEKHFYRGLITQLKNNPNLLNALVENQHLKQGDSLVGLPLDDGSIDMKVLLTRFFMMKRWDERFINIINELQGEPDLRSTIISLYGAISYQSSL